MLSRVEEYVDRGLDAYEQERRDAQCRHLERGARALGMTLSPADNADTSHLAPA